MYIHPTHHLPPQQQAQVSGEMMDAILTVADGDMRKAVTTLQSAHQVGAYTHMPLSPCLPPSPTQFAN